MATLNMEGSYILSTDVINEKVTRTSPGNYALGYVKDDKIVSTLQKRGHPLSG